MSTTQESIDLYTLLDQPRDSDVINAFRKSFKQSEIKQIKSTIYENYYEDGISMCFEPSSTDTSTLVLDSIFFYTQGAEKNKYKGYKGRLPHDLTFDMTNADIVKKFGEPDGKPPHNNVVNMFVDYKSLGLQIDFMTKSYDDNKNPIVSICIYKPDKSEEKEDQAFVDRFKKQGLLRCEHCGRFASERVVLKQCAGCHKVWYCGQECQKKDWTTHKTACKSR